jgi:hypothetical protein
MDTDDRRAIAKSYTATVGPADHHIQSFNEFLTSGAPAIVTQLTPVEIEIDDEGETPPMPVKFDELQYSRPHTLESDGSQRDIYL